MESWAAYKTQQKLVNDLIPYDRNPKIHPDTQITQLANSIREWGWTMPILIDENDQIIAGHGRLYAAKQLMIEEVPCVVATGWSDQQKKAYVIADNKIAENSEWDTGAYFTQLKEMNSSGFDLSLMGVDIDLSNFDFKPNVEPTSVNSMINENDMVRADQKIEGQMDHLGKEKSEGSMDVMCPYCQEEFKVSGY